MIFSEGNLSHAPCLRQRQNLCLGLVKPNGARIASENSLRCFVFSLTRRGSKMSHWTKCNLSTEKYFNQNFRIYRGKIFQNPWKLHWSIFIASRIIAFTIFRYIIMMALSVTLPKTDIVCESTENYGCWQPYCRLTPRVQRTPANIRINLILLCNTVRNSSSRSRPRSLILAPNGSAYTTSY